jgi:hypothetical protein
MQMQMQVEKVLGPSGRTRTPQHTQPTFLHLRKLLIELRILLLCLFMSPLDLGLEDGGRLSPRLSSLFRLGQHACEVDNDLIAEIFPFRQRQTGQIAVAICFGG